MSRLINVGFGNVVNSNKIVGIISPDAAPIKRLVQNAKDAGNAIDATCGRKTKAVLVMDSGHLVLSALLPETIANRINLTKENADSTAYTNL
ncbi:UPF0296 protein YlzA [Anaerocolumna cellulosilytica]|uniref:Putative regulatory protein acsn021_23920 n=1 Tax=Anaerocolumna cellulosilytica TaxID=433286 RepID=A0A6S6QU39_9FIRM|nr:DUF370 domain-containing protein [Anaerocolumna cellulosilytica]MBB5193963.1 hypothetical protein [Anaerocolumna cellulosilytica]BCJ94823.1 UPF0296 protein YlzA [Anaerocolumna cellulosilytica]